MNNAKIVQQRHYREKLFKLTFNTSVINKDLSTLDQHLQKNYYYGQQTWKLSYVIRNYNNKVKFGNGKDQALKDPKKILVYKLFSLLVLVSPFRKTLYYRITLNQFTHYKLQKRFKKGLEMDVNDIN
ncbi:unnamed protein product (macronuclear) [Paramecium tetraurelia]|uniref:Uncharacterized protein n=1 Tax=Paramecium tetraurelia TaxID=5888 RepID=A0D652_PARTE|nr:uncharacterized protein GSPATT00013949001 [Paramecium tetraurelia]CAK78519.1 unnamed protein product [Paramecium tetraurelia]|eukprot:XP_001445916.1 hypothetical protein (macronuclear) [Paramecium tetraurelia strain d4-2]